MNAGEDLEPACEFLRRLHGRDSIGDGIIRSSYDFSTFGRCHRVPAAPNVWGMRTQVDSVSEGLRTADVEEVESIETDYVVIGAGAMGMAFTDVLLKQDRKATVVVVDRHPAPGGHWN